MLKALSFIFLFIFCSLALGAQEVLYEHYATGVDFWVVLPYSSLSFAKGKNVADYQLSVVIKDSRKKQAADFSTSISIPKRDWLQDTAIPIRFAKSLKPGIYSADFKLKNKSMGSKLAFKRSFEVGAKYTEIGQSWLVAKKEGFSYIPNTLTPDCDELSLFQSFSVPLDSILISTPNRSLRIDQLSSPLQVNLKPFLDSNSGSITKLYMYEGNIHYNVDPFIFSPWYSYSLRYSPGDQLAQLRYVASQNEWQSLHSVPTAKISQAIEAYWKVNDPSPGTARNESRERFYQRVLKADEMFTVHKKLKGWNSDRGRIYIKYGEPDEIVTEAYPIGRYPNIIWTYYKQDKEFIFADTKGFGLYTLRNKEDEY